MSDLPDWDELTEREQKTVDLMIILAENVSHLEPERLILMMAFLTDAVVNTLADRVLAARQMGMGDLLDAKTHLAGMALATSMGEYRQAYEICFDPKLLGEVEKSMEKSLAVVDQLYKDGMTPEGIQRLLNNLEHDGEAE